MRTILTFIFILLTLNIGFGQNLANPYDASDNAPLQSNTLDGNPNTYWTSAGGNQYIVYKLSPAVRFISIQLWNVTTYSGNIQISPDGSNWTTVSGPGSNFYACSYASFTNIYKITGTDFMQIQYVKINLSNYPQYQISVSDVRITEDKKFFTSFTGSDYYANPAVYALDGDLSTYFLNYNSPMSLNVQLANNWKAMNVHIKADTKRVRVDVTDVNGHTAACYYYTLSPDETFLVVDPTGIESITVSSENNDPVYLYELQLSEVPIGSVSLSYGYDNAGNMNFRTIVLSINGQKSAKASLKDTIIPFEAPITDKLQDKVITLYPNPTSGQVKVDISNTAPSDKASIQVYSAAGIKVYEIQNAQPSNVIDLLKQANGTYFMILNINSETQKWTIIKQ